MSTDPTFTVEWTVPSEDERGVDGPEETDADGSAEAAAGASATGDDRLVTRDPADLPPAPVLAAHVDELRSDRRAAERQVDAVRERYETIIGERDEEIARLRERLEDESLFARLRNLL